MADGEDPFASLPGGGEAPNPNYTAPPTPAASNAPNPWADPRGVVSGVLGSPITVTSMGRTAAQQAALIRQGAQAAPVGQSAHERFDAQGNPEAMDFVTKPGATLADLQAAAQRLAASGVPYDDIRVEPGYGGHGPHIHVSWDPRMRGTTAGFKALASDPFASLPGGGEADNPNYKGPADPFAALPGGGEAPNPQFKGPPGWVAPVEAGANYLFGRPNQEAFTGVKTFTADRPMSPRDFTEHYIDTVQDIWGKLARGSAPIVRGIGALLDAGRENNREQWAQILGEDTTPQAPKTFSKLVAPAAAALTTADKRLSVPDPSRFQKVTGGAAEMAPAMGAALWNPGAGVLAFGASGYDQTYQDAKARGATDAQADQAARTNAAIQATLGGAMGPTEQLAQKGFGAAAKRLLPGLADKTIAQFLGKMGLSAGVQYGFGAGMAGGENLAAQGYDPKRPWDQGMTESGQNMAMLSVLFHVAPHVLSTIDSIGRAQTARSGPNVDVSTMPATSALEGYAGAAPTAPANPLAPGGKPIPQKVVDEAAKISEDVRPETVSGAARDVATVEEHQPGEALLAAVVRLGGLKVKDDAGEMTPEGGDITRIFDQTKRPGLINNRTGKTADEMREALKEEGWFGKEGDSLDELYQMLGWASGASYYHPDSAHAEDAERVRAIEGEMAQAGVASADHPLVAAAKLAAWREEQTPDDHPKLNALKDKADALGVPYRPDVSYEELLGDVVEREAMQDEGLNSGTLDEHESAIDAELSTDDHQRIGDHFAERLAEVPGAVKGARGHAEDDHEPAPPAEAVAPRAGAAGGGEGAREAAGEGQRLDKGEVARRLNKVIDHHISKHDGDAAQDVGEALQRVQDGRLDPEDAAHAFNLFTREEEYARGTPEMKRAMDRLDAMSMNDPKRPEARLEWFRLRDQWKRDALARINGEASPDKPTEAELNAEADRTLAELRRRDRTPGADVSTWLREKMAGQDEAQAASEPKAEEPKPEPAAHEPAQPAEAPKGYGDSNTVFTKEQYEANRAKLRAMLGRMNAGLDPEMVRIGIETAGYHIESGARAFGDFAKAMIDDFGETVRPYLKMWYNAVRDYPGFDSRGMTPYEELTPALVAAAGKSQEELAKAPPTERIEAQAVIQGHQAATDARTYQPAAMPITAADPEPERDPDLPTVEVGEPASVKPGVTALNPARDQLVIVHVSKDGEQVITDGGAILRTRDVEPGLSAVDNRSKVQGHGLQSDLFAGSGVAGPEAVSAAAGEREAGGVRPTEGRGSPPDDRRPVSARASGQARVPEGRAGEAAGAGAGAGADAGVSGGSGQSGDAGRPDAAVTGTDYRIDPGALAEERGPKAKARGNLEAIRLAKSLIAEQRAATREEQQILARYVGWGGLSGAFKGSDGKFTKGMEDVGAELEALLTPEEHAAAARSTQYAHYTSEPVIRAMWKAMRDLGFKGGSVFEPGMGVGHFLGLMPPDLAAKSRYQGVEIDPLTASIAKLLYPKSGVRQADFTQTALPDNHFDVVIGNPPFADTVVKADPKYAARRLMLHNYFFAKSLDALRPGGLLGFVTSAGTMNAMDPAARAFMGSKAEFVGGIRLPGDAFAKNAGTSVTTDILFFRKRAEPISEADAAREPWTDTASRSLPDGKGGQKTGPVSRYFSDHPEQVLGEETFDGKLYEGRYGVESRPGQDLERELDAAVARLPKDVMGEAETPAQRAEADFAGPERQHGSFYVKDGKLMQVHNGVGRAVESPRKGVEGGVSAADQAKIRGLIPIRDALRAVFRADQIGDAEGAERARADLHKAYDAFVAKYGPINKTEFSSRRPTPGEIAKAREQAMEDAREQEIPWDESMFNPDDMEDVVKEKLPNLKPFLKDQQSHWLRFIEEYNSATGKAEKKKIFYEDVRSKEVEPQLNSANDGVLWSLNQFGRLDLDRIAEKMGRDKDGLIEELGDGIYRKPGTDDVYLTRDDYLSGDIYDKLAEARTAAAADPGLERNVKALEAAMPVPLGPSEITMTLGMPWIPVDTFDEFVGKRLGISGVSMLHSPHLGAWVVKGDGYGPGSVEWSTDERRAGKLVAAAMNRQAVRVTKTEYDPYSGAKREVFDPVATQLAQDKVTAMREAFGDWVETKKDQLADLYNAVMNRVVLRVFDGAYLTTPGVSSDWSWRPHQMRFIARVIQAGNTYMAHAVGAGKTSAMIGAGMEMRRLGLIKKPMYVVPKSMLAQFAKEFYEQYPTARILVADEQQFHTDRRKEFTADVAQGDYDAVIMTHPSFGKIGVSDEFRAGLIREELENLEHALKAIDKGGDRFTIKQMEKRKEKLEQQLEAALGSKKDATHTFEDLGVDFLFVDEAHKFRKLTYNSSQRLKGISPEGSQMAFDLFAKIRYLESKTPGRSVVLASGTPVTNTMGELYSLSRYIQRPELERRGLAQFDSWASAYGDVQTSLEQTADGGYKPATRFATFVNSPELYKMVGQNMDVVTPGQLEEYVVRPKLKGGERQFHVAPRTPELEAFQEALKARAAALEARRGKPQKGEDNILKIIGDGRLAAIDPRFVNPDADPHLPSKLNMMLDNVHAIWARTHDVQFKDPRTNYQTDGPRGPATQMIFSNLGINNTRGFSTYEWIAKDLVRRGIPRSEIAFIGDYKDALAKQKLYNDMNEGKVRILIGSTDKMGVGVNAQKRLYALHNLDPLWYPADDEQRVGRILRQGNQNPEIEVHDYSTHGTYDAAMWQMMGRKARFIEQFFRGDPELRNLPDVGEASLFEQLAGMLSSDPRVLELTELKQQLDKANRRRAAHEREQYSLGQRIRWAQAEIEEADKAIPLIQRDIAQRVPTEGDQFEAKIGGKSYAKRADAAKALEKAYEQAYPGLKPLSERATVAELGGFKISVENAGPVGPRFFLEREGGPTRSIKLAEGTSTSILGVIQRAENRIADFDKSIEYLQKSKAENTQAIADMSGQLGKEFTGGEEIDRLKTAVKGLEAQIKAANDGASKEAAAAPKMASSDAGDEFDDEDYGRGPRFSRKAPEASDRLGMTPKEASARVPELQAAAAKVASGEMSAAAYQMLVDRYKPVLPYDHVPDLASHDQIREAVSSNKRDKVGALDSIPQGSRVSVRLDIPAYTNHGVWVPTVHDAKGMKTVAYEPAVHITNAAFGMREKEALRIAQGGAKAPFAAIDGDLVHTDPEAIRARAQAALNDPAWRQVGMDPERHSYFYDRETHEPITHADEVLQVGPLVLARNPVYGDRAGVMFQRARPFYSALERFVTDKGQNSATAEQWKATLENAPGVKKEELEWSGLKDWLALHGDQKVSKDAVQAFLRDNGVQIKEVDLHDVGDDGGEREEHIRARAQEIYAEMGGGEGWHPDVWDEAEQRAIDELGGDTQFRNWTLPGGSDYHELLLTLPSEANPPRTHWDTPGVLAHVRFDTRTDTDGKKVLFVQEVQSDWHQKGRDQGYKQPADPEAIDAAQQRFNEAMVGYGVAQKNLIAEAERQVASGETARVPPHRAAMVRQAEATLRDNQGHPAMQAGAASQIVWATLGYDSRQVTEPYEDSKLAVEEATQALMNAKSPSGIPNAPFKTSWPALVMKRVIAWAADHDFDKVAWTTGEQQAARYSLTKRVGYIDLHDNVSGGIGHADMEGPFKSGTLHVYDPDGKTVISKPIYSEEDLHETLGKELTQKLLAAEPTRERYAGMGVRSRALKGLDVKIGGEGMRGFYDRNLVNIVNDLIKKYGGKVGTSKITGTASHSEGDLALANSDEFHEAQREVQARYYEMKGAEDWDKAAAHQRWVDARNHADEIEQRVRAGAGSDQHSFDITDSLRDAATHGFPLFQRAPESAPSPLDGTERLTRGLHGEAVGHPTVADRKVIDAVHAVLDKIAPTAVSKPMRKLLSVDQDGKVGELWGAQYRKGLDGVIAWALGGGEKTARHEAVHFLRDEGLFTDKEWAALEAKAESEDWAGRYDVDRIWGDDNLTPEERAEESIAEGFSYWRDGLFKGLPPFVERLFKRLDLALRQVADAVRRIRGKDVTAEDVFSRIESGEIGRRALDDGWQAPRLGDRYDGRDEAPAQPALHFSKVDPDKEPDLPLATGKGPDFFNRVLGEGAESVGAKLQAAAQKWLPDPLKEIIHAVHLGVSPMAAGTPRSRAVAKDFANTLRAVRWEWGRVDLWLERNFTPEQRERMWSAADEESVLRQAGMEPGPHAGLNRLSESERATVLELQRRANQAFQRARALGMTTAEGIPSYVPRLVVQMTAEGAKKVGKGQGKGKVTTTTGNLRQRKHLTVEETEAAAQAKFGEGAVVIKDIRALAYATGKLEAAIAGRTLIENIKAVGKLVGQETVHEGGNPDPNAFFTMDGEAAFRRWGPKEFVKDPDTGKMVPLKDENGKVIIESKPLYVPKEFEGPLKAVLDSKTGPVYNALMTLKGKIMSVIMYSPLMHNAVIWGKAIPAAPMNVMFFGVYRKGYLAKNDPATMTEALRAGLDPIGRYFNQQSDTAIQTPPDLKPGHGWTAQVLGAIPGLFDPKAGDAVKRAVDKLDNLWHNTFLWDRVGDLQMGLYTIIRDKKIKEGYSPDSAQKLAAHFANRYAGAMPQEAMSKAARMMANLVFFSRSFTLGNAGAYKDVVGGLPADMRGQILRDDGAKMLERVQGEARRKAATMLVMDVALDHIGLFLASAAVFAVGKYLLGDDKRKFVPESENEPGKGHRFFIGYDKDGTALYGRLPTGKVGEELVDWVTEPVETFKKKMSPFAHLMYELAANDKGYGRKVYDPNDKTPMGFVRNVGRVTAATMEAVLPTGMYEGIEGLIGTKQKKSTALLETMLPLLGITISHGAPGGPAMGDLYQAKSEHDFKVNEALPDIRQQIRNGDVAGAKARMTALGIPPQLQAYYIKTTVNPASKLTPRAMRDFRRYATPEEQQKLQEDRAAASVAGSP